MDAGDPLPFDTQPGGGGNKPAGRNKRRSSILKPQRPVLQDLNTNTAGSTVAPTQSKPERSRRVSFSRKQQIKEFKAGQDNLTLWNSSYHEELSSNSSSNVSSQQQQSNSLSKGGGRVDLQGGQLASVSPSKALPLNINIPDANSPNKFLPSAAVEETDDIFHSSQPAAATRSFLSSLASAEGRRESESSDDVDSSFSRLLSNISSKTMVGEVDMSRTCAAISDSMLPDDDEDDGESVKVNALGFLAGLEDESVHEGQHGKTVLGGGMDVTMGNRMEMTMARMDRTMDSNTVHIGNRTTLGGGMDVTIAPSSTSDKMEMTLGLVEPASGLSKTLGGGGMEITGEGLISKEEGIVPDGDYTRHGGGMETTLVSSNLPDSLPNSNNSSFDGGATATVKFSQLALANNTLMLPRYIIIYTSLFTLNIIQEGE